MSNPQKTGRLRPSSGAAPFDLKDVFFSRTDARGVILAANSVFWSVTALDPAKGLGAPHKIIRHPDMPRGVFQLFWDTLNRGDMIGAYVKNRAADGLYYWVYAVAVPCGDGFLSARIKPTSPMLDVVAREYAALKQAEEDEGLTPTQSARCLCDRLRALGHGAYHEFSTFALADELRARAAGLGKPPDPRLERYARMKDITRGLQQATRDLVGEFERSSIIPHNMRLIASRLEPTGGPISTLSTNYGAMSREMADWFAANVSGPDSDFASVTDCFVDSTFHSAMLRLLVECREQLDQEPEDVTGLNRAEEQAHLDALIRRYGARDEFGRCKVRAEAESIQGSCGHMARFILGLSTTQSMCKTEGARIESDTESLDDVIQQLSVTQGRTEDALERVREFAGRLTMGAD